jgi:hypothetical protein
MNSSSLERLAFRQLHASHLARGYGGTRLARAANKVLAARSRALARGIIESHKNKEKRGA